MDFLKDVGSRVLVASGPLGTEMEKRGYLLSDNSALWSLKNPDLYKDVLRRFIDSGSEVIHGTNSSCNRIVLARLGMADQAFEVARDWAKLAKEACPPGCYLSGGMGNLGQLLQPLGEISYEDAYGGYKEQALAMAEGGVDLVWIMTMTDTPAMEAAIKAVKDNTALPVIASMVFNPTKKGYRTMMGHTPVEIAQRLDRAGADIIGANCGTISPSQTTEVLREMAGVTKKPLVAKPNAGKPEVVDGVTVHPMSPEDMAAHVPSWIEAGAKIVSGCCGASPEHIARIAEMARRPTNR